MFETQIARGVEYLDQKEGPDWVERINLDTLELSSSCNCVIGQLYESFHGQFSTEEEASELGFCIPYNKPGIWYIDLTRAWKEKIKQLRAERVEQC